MTRTIRYFQDPFRELFRWVNQVATPWHFIPLVLKNVEVWKTGADLS